MTMLLDLAKLEKVRRSGEKYVARCPACAKEGADKKGQHLVIMPNGRYGCVVHSGASGSKHRKEIFNLAATDEAKTHGPVMIRVRPAPEDRPRVLGRFGRGGEALAVTPITAVRPPVEGSGGGTDGSRLEGMNLGEVARAAHGVTEETDVQSILFDSRAESDAPQNIEQPIETDRPEAVATEVSIPARANAAVDFESILQASRDDLDRVAADIAGAARIALDLETYGQRKGDGLDPFRGEIRLLSVSRHGGPVWMLDLRAIGYDLGPLKPILEGAEIVAHNAKFDLLWLRVRCGLDCRRAFCTMTAARLLRVGSSLRNGLDDCLHHYLDVPPGPDHSTSDWGGLMLSPEQLAYAGRDVAYLHDLAGVLEHELENGGLDEVWELERGLLPCVVDMEFAGIGVDRSKMNAVEAQGRVQASEAERELRGALGAPSLNLDSPAQLLAALKEAGIKIDSTKEGELKRADDGRLIPMVLRYREATKRAQQAETLIKKVAADGRIHSRFEPTGTDTGRFSSRDPNLQNIGRGELREAFVPAPGHKFVVADYSQIELRAAAAIAGEEKMIEAYQNGKDLHRLTAAALLDVDPAEVGKEQRQLAKAANFGNLFGQGAAGLASYAANSYGVELDVEEARILRERFFNTYEGLRRWHASCWEGVRQQAPWVKTRLGRRRLIPNDATDWQRFTALVNTPVQGGTADGIKYAIVLLSERLPAGARLVSTVHDEVVVECPESEAEAVRGLVIEIMKEAMATLFSEVPIEVEASIGDSWAEK